MNDRTRVAIVSPNPGSQNGGVERFCHLLAGALARGGHAAEVTGWPVTGEGWDLVVTNGMTGAKTRAPRIHVFHGSWIGSTLWGDPVSSWHWRVRSAVRGCSREIRAGRGATRVAVAPAAADEVRRFYRLDVHRVIPNAVDTAVFAPRGRAEARALLGWARDARIALFVGRPEPLKQPAFALAAAHAAGMELWSAGSAAVPGGDRHLGALPPEATAVAMAAADCVLAPSLYEGCSLTVLESLAVGTPVVATRVGWVPELIRRAPDYAPLTAGRGDRDGFHRAVRLAIAHPELAEHATDHVRRHNDLPSWSRSWLDLVDGVLGRESR